MNEVDRSKLWPMVLLWATETSKASATELERIVDSIAEERARPARELLREHSHDSCFEKCIECDGYEHTPDCKLAAEIAKLLKVTT